MYPFLFMAKCQSKNFDQQFFSGVRLFDLRLFFNAKGEVCVRHGILTFKVCYSTIMHDMEILNLMAKDGETVYVRVMLEQNHYNRNQEALNRHFCQFCRILEESFPAVKFFGGTRKFDYLHLYDFHTPEPPIIHRYSSTTSPFGENKNRWYARLDDFWPWLYAHFHNADSLRRYADTDSYLMLDFI
jgi:hypothetical protein